MTFPVTGMLDCVTSVVRWSIDEQVRQVGGFQGAGRLRELRSNIRPLRGTLGSRLQDEVQDLRGDDCRSPGGIPEAGGPNRGRPGCRAAPVAAPLPPPAPVPPVAPAPRTARIPGVATSVATEGVPVPLTGTVPAPARRTAPVEPARRPAPEPVLARDSRTGSAVKVDLGDLAPPVRKAQVPAAANTPADAPAAAPVAAAVAEAAAATGAPAAPAEARATRPPREGGRGEGTARTEADPPPHRHRRRIVPHRASLVPTFVLSAILALVVALSVYFGQDPVLDPVPAVRRAHAERLAGESSKPDQDGPSRQDR